MAAGLSYFAWSYSAPLPKEFYYPFPISEVKRLDQEEVRVARERLALNPSEQERLALAAALIRSGRAFNQSEPLQEAKTLLVQFTDRAPAVELLRNEIRLFFHEFKSVGQSLVSLPEDHLEVMDLAVRYHMALGDYDLAAAKAAQLVARLPTSGSYHLAGMVSEQRGEFGLAEKFFRQALRREEPGELLASAYTRLLLARVLMIQKRWPEAKLLLTESFKLNPVAPLAHSLWGDWMSAFGRWHEAENSYQMAFRHSHNPLFLLKQARTYEERRWTDKAQRLRWQVVELYRASGIELHRYELAQAYISLNEKATLETAASLLSQELSERRPREIQTAFRRIQSQLRQL